MTQQKHIEWKAEINENGNFIMNTDKGDVDPIGEIFIGSHLHFIIKACNNYYKLLEACKFAKHYLSNGNFKCWEQIKPSHISLIMRIEDILEQAIKESE